MKETVNKKKERRPDERPSRRNQAAPRGSPQAFHWPFATTPPASGLYLSAQRFPHMTTPFIMPAAGFGAGLAVTGIGHAGAMPEPAAARPESIAEQGEPAGAEYLEAGFGMPPRILPGREELRLDVDGWYPQMIASGTWVGGLTHRVHWIADLAAAGQNRWTGTIWYKDGAVGLFPYTRVDVQITRSWLVHQRKAKIQFSGAGRPDHVRVFRFASPHFREVEFEFDCAEGTNTITSIRTDDHPNRPAGLPAEDLTIGEVYERAGMRVTHSPGGSVPLVGSGANAKWSDTEMHDAMQNYWSNFANKAQWSMWIFFAHLHEMGTSLGGVMFDDIGPNHRQGTAIFRGAFISQAPPGDPDPAAWVKRMNFWTACHEMGHGFNLAHSWQKSLGAPYGTPWIPLADEDEARSFMNYPYNVAGGQTAFFADFEYRFSDSELLFMRHAPERFVEPGAADWFDHHGFRQAAASPEPGLRLEVRMNRSRPALEFLEPAVVELKLTNVSRDPIVLDDDLLDRAASLAIIVKRQGRPARRYHPYSERCRRSERIVIEPGRSLYESVFLGAGRGGWLIDEPGTYLVQAALNHRGEEIVSRPIMLRVTPPKGYDEEVLAQDFFADEVGRVFAFDGSLAAPLRTANDTLHEVVGRLAKSAAARHARIALGKPFLRPHKTLVIPGPDLPFASVGLAGGNIDVASARAKDARQLLQPALIVDMSTAAETLGHIDFRYYVEDYTDRLFEEGDKSEALRIAQNLHKTMIQRQVLASVLDDIDARCDAYKRGQKPEFAPATARPRVPAVAAATA